MAFLNASVQTKVVIGKLSNINKKPGKLAKPIRFNIEDHLENDYDDDGHYIGKIKRNHPRRPFFLRNS